MLELIKYPRNNSLGLSRSLFDRFLDDSSFDSFFTKEFYDGNLRSDKDNYYLEYELPGVGQENLEVNVENNILTVSVKENTKNRKYAGAWSRSIGPNINIEKINATYENGVLTITLPKTEAAKPKKISIKVN